MSNCESLSRTTSKTLVGHQRTDEQMNKHTKNKGTNEQINKMFIHHGFTSDSWRNVEYKMCCHCCLFLPSHLAIDELYEFSNFPTQNADHVAATVIVLQGF